MSGGFVAKGEAEQRWPVTELVDAVLVEQIFARRIVGAPVIAHVEKMVRRDAAGRHGRPAYRLVGIDEEPSLPADVGSA